MDATHPRARHLPIRWGLLAASVLVLAAIVWLRGQEPSFEDKLAPFVLSGATGQRVEARNFAVRVKRLKLAQAYRTPGAGFDSAPVQAGADGVWLSVLVDVEPTREPGYVSAWLRAADGRTFLAASGDRPRVGNLNFANVQLATGLVGQGAYFFDLPEDALPGARLRFFWGLSKPGDMDHLVEIDPGLDAAAVRALREGAQPVIDLVP
jgi:hypothetical protein